MSVRIVENNTIHKIFLPETPSFPSGIWLLPGLGTKDSENNVPEKYFAELDAKVAIMADGSEYPVGRKALEQFLAPVKNYDATGSMRRGPQITIYNQDQAPSDNRAAWPEDLNSCTEKQAKAFATACKDAATLRKWLNTTTNEKVLAHLRGLGA